MATSHESPDDNSIAAYDEGRADFAMRARAAYTAIIVAVLIAGLYFGRDVLVPIAFAVLLSFVLAPLANLLRRLHLGQAVAVFLSVFLAFAILVGLGGLIGKQVAELAGDLPAYQRVINDKVEALRASDVVTGLMERGSGLLQGFNLKPRQRPSHPPQAEPTAPAEPTPLPVEVRQQALGPIQILESILSALLPPLTTAAIVVVFVIFILFQQRDLRDRLIGIIGAHDLHRTTKALDDAADSPQPLFHGPDGDQHRLRRRSSPWGLPSSACPTPFSGASSPGSCASFPISARSSPRPFRWRSPPPSRRAGPWSSKPACSSSFSRA